MRESLKITLLVTLTYFNPVAVYWYASVYRESTATVYSLVGSALLSLGMVFVLKRFLPLKWWSFSIIVLISNFFIASVLLITSQVLFAERVFGFEELGIIVITTYAGLSVFTPAFWLNTFVCGGLFLISKTERKPVNTKAL